MLPTKFRFIWPIDLRQEEFKKSANQKQEFPVATTFVNGLGRNAQSVQMTFLKCFLPTFGSFGQSVSEQKSFKNQPIRNINHLRRPFLLTDRDEMSSLYRGSSTDASYQISVHLIWAVSEENIFLRNQPIRHKNFLWRPCLLMDQDEMSNFYTGPSIDASYQVSVHLANWFQRRIILKIRKKNDLWWPCLLTDRDEKSNGICYRCFLPNFGWFGKAVSEKKNFTNRPIRNKNFLWRPRLLMDQDEMSNLYRWPSIDASFQDSVHLAN